MISCSSFSLKYHHSQHATSVRKFRSPLTKIKGLVNRRESCSQYSIKCSIKDSSFNLTNEYGIIRRNHKPLDKTFISSALQDSQELEPSNATFGDVLMRKLDAFYRLSRPYTWTTLIGAMVSASFFPVQGLADLTPAFFIEVLKCIAPTLVMTIFVNAINQLSDIEIDKVNKPNLPLVSGDLSIGEGVGIAVVTTLLSLAMGVMLRSPPLIVALILRWIVGAAYSVDLPFLRWKGSPLMAAVSIVMLNPILLQFPYFIHIQKYVLGRPIAFTKPLLFAAGFTPFFSIALAFLKDIPDVEGDKENGVRTLPVIIGKEKVFSISVNIILMAYGGAVLAGASSSSMLCKLVTMISHSAMAFMLWRKAQSVDLSNAKSTYSFFIFIIQLYYVELILMHFVR